MPYKDPEQSRAYRQRPERKKSNREGMRRWRANNLEIAQAREHAYYMAHRDEITEKKRQQRLENPEAYYAAERKWSAANHDKIRKKTRRYRQEHPEKPRAWESARRARIANAPRIERIDHARIYARDGGICHICGLKVPVKERSLDHLIPLARGGNHTEDNVALAHRRCNSRMGAGRLPAQLRMFG